MNHFTNQYEEQFGSDLVGEAEAFLGIAGAEAFFAARGQIDMLISEEDVDLSGMLDQEDWSLAGFVRRTRDLAEAALVQEKPAALVAKALARAMSEILGGAVLKAEAKKADDDDDCIRAKEVAERSRCLALLRASVADVEDKITSGGEAQPVGPGGESVGFVEVDEDGVVIKGGRRKKKPSTKAKPGKDRVSKSVVTATGLTIRVG